MRSRRGTHGASSSSSSSSSRTCVRSLDDMAERELAKQSSKSVKQSKQYTQKEFDELTRLMPDPATQQDSLLADGTLLVLVFYFYFYFYFYLYFSEFSQVP